MKQLFLCISIFLLIISGQAQQHPAVLAYIDQYKQLAVDEMLRTGVPAAIKLAQGIHETQAGQSDLVLRSNNHFGIKCKSSWTGAKVYHDDDAAQECFRSYAEAAESYRDHSDFLRNNARYAFLFKLDPTDYAGWAYGLKKAGYATNVKYSQILIKLIETYNLQDYSLIALGKKAPTGDLVVGIRPPAEKNPVIPEPSLPDAPTPALPTGVFEINHTKVVAAKAGTSLLALAEQHHLSLSRLLDFNDITPGEGDILLEDQLIFLQRKKKTGASQYHVVKPNETLYDIAQQEGIRYGSLLELNHLKPDMEPAPGERLYLKEKAPRQPLLASAKRPNTAESTAQKSDSPKPAHTPAKNPYAKQVANTNKAIQHIVREKETLYSISKKYGVQVSDLMAWNRLRGSGLQKGQKLLIYSN
jgi:flagellum-specific peptidoglycan hydrolase FlgJ